MSTTTTTQRTTIEVTGIKQDSKSNSVDLDFEPPKDAIILAEESHHAFGGTGSGIKSYRVVYETVKKEVQGRTVLREGDGSQVVVQDMRDCDLDDHDVIMIDHISERPSGPTRKDSGEGSDSTLKPNSKALKKAQRWSKHALEEEEAARKSDREKKRGKRFKDAKDNGRREIEKREKEKRKKKEKLQKDNEKEKKDRGLHMVFAAIHTQVPSHPSLPTPPSPNPRWMSTPTDYFSVNPAQQEVPYATAMKRSSSVTMTSSSQGSANSRTDSYVTSWQDTIQSTTPSGTQLRRQYSREVLPMGKAGSRRPSISESSLMNGSASPLQSRQGGPSPYAPSIHTLRTTLSQTSLSLEYISLKDGNLRNTDDMLGRSYYPHDHLCRNMTKFMRFASASYGSNFMRILGIGASHTLYSETTSRALQYHPGHHAEHHAFSAHTSVPVETILLSSFTDPGGGYDMHGDVNTGVPLVHFICVDHTARAIVLTCRGTLGLDDVVTDLTCEYGDMEVRGKKYRVHKGMLNSALLLLKTRRAKVLMTLRNALETHEGYGLVLCGHSLGGGVAAILSILLSTPTNRGGFVTSNTIYQDVRLPEGRPIHCYAYGAPACVCPKLRKETKGLITSVVHGRDVVPSLSFGMIRDFHSVALAFKEDSKGLRKEIGKMVWGNLTQKATSFASGTVNGYPSTTVDADNRTKEGENSEKTGWPTAAQLFEDRDDEYLYAILKTLRAGMDTEKLVPPGEVYVVETQTVFQQSRDGGVDIKPATRITTRVVKDVEKRFCEINFGQGMFSDHSPAKYEVALEMLLRGVCDEDIEFV